MTVVVGALCVALPHATSLFMLCLGVGLPVHQHASACVRPSDSHSCTLGHRVRKHKYVFGLTFRASMCLLRASAPLVLGLPSGQVGSCRVRIRHLRPPETRGNALESTLFLAPSCIAGARKGVAPAVSRGRQIRARRLSPRAHPPALFRQALSSQKAEFGESIQKVVSDLTAHREAWEADKTNTSEVLTSIAAAHSAALGGHTAALADLKAAHEASVAQLNEEGKAMATEIKEALDTQSAEHGKRLEAVKQDLDSHKTATQEALEAHKANALSIGGVSRGQASQKSTYSGLLEHERSRLGSGGVVVLATPVAARKTTEVQIRSGGARPQPLRSVSLPKFESGARVLAQI